LIFQLVDIIDNHNGPTELVVYRALVSFRKTHL